MLLTTLTTVRARAFGTGWTPSEPVLAEYTSVLPTSTVTRYVAYDPASASQVIQLVTAPASGVKSYAIEEHLPPLVTPVAISGGGVWDATNFVVRWGPFQDGLARTLTNVVTGPAGTYLLTGTASLIWPMRSRRTIERVTSTPQRSQITPL